MNWHKNHFLLVYYQIQCSLNKLISLWISSNTKLCAIHLMVKTQHQIYLCGRKRQSEELECPDPDVASSTKCISDREKEANPKNSDAQMQRGHTRGWYGHRRPFWSPISCFRRRTKWGKSIQSQNGKNQYVLWASQSATVCFRLAPNTVGGRLLGADLKALVLPQNWFGVVATF